MTTAARPQRADGSSFERVRAALELADCRPRGRGSTHLDARCPAHEDRRPSLSVDWRDSPDRGGLTVVCCQTGCPGDAVAAALGLSLAELFDSWEPRGVVAAQPVQNSAKQQMRKSVPKPSPPRPRRGWPRAGELTAVYRYERAGELVGEVGRFVDGDGKTFRWRRPAPDRPGWWLFEKPTDVPLYRQDAAGPAIERGEPVYVVEGEKDADALTERGLTAVSKSNGAVKAADEWRPEWTAALAGAHVVIVADRDAAGYRHAAAVRDALADTPASVRIVRTPIDTDKADVSDHLAAGLSVTELVPVPATELPAAEPERPGRVLPGPWPGSDDDRRGGGGGEPPATPMQVVRDEYAADDRGLYKLGPVKRGQREARELLNTRVRLARRVRRDMGDGTRPAVSHVDLEARRGRDAVELTAVQWDDFEKLTWTTELPWPDVTYRRTPAGRSDVVNAIAQTSGEEVPVVTAYGTLGWRRRPDSSWMYVHAAGAIDAAGPVDATRVDIPADLLCYALPEPPTDPSTLTDAVVASTGALDLLPARIAAPLLGAAYRAILGESSTTVFLLGSTGTGKSGLAAQLLQHSAPSVRHDRLPIPAGEDGATVTAIEELRYIAGHVPFVADDLAPDKGADRSATRANILARSQHNRVGKLRGKRDGGTRPHHYPRGLLVLTGEDGASAPSAENRIVYVPIGRGEVSPTTLAALETDTLCTGRAQLTAALIRWAADRMPLDDWIRRTRAEFAAQLRDPTADPGPDARRADAAADLAVGWRAMLDAAVHLGALHAGEAEQIWAQAWTGLAEAKARQALVTAGRTLPERAADVLRSALVAGRVHVAARDGSDPGPDLAELTRWGWTPGPVGMHGPVDPRPAGTCVGWISRDVLWLEPGAALAALEGQSRAEGEPMRTTSRSLGAALRDAGLLLRTSKDQTTVGGCRAAGSQRRVWELPVSWLFPEEHPDAPAEAAPPPPPPAPVPAPTAGGAPESVPGPGDRADRIGQAHAAGTGGQVKEPPPATTTPTTPMRSSAEMQNSTSPELGEPLQASDAAHAALAHVHGRGGQAHTGPPGDGEGRDASSRDASAATQYRASAIVVDVDRAHLAVLGADPAELPAPPAALADLLAWAVDAPLGTHHDYAPDDYGQVWVTPAAAQRYGLPAKRPSEAGARKLAAARELAAAGWELGKGGFGWWWVKAWRPGGRTVFLVLPSWASTGDCPLLAGDPAPAELADRIARYARHVGAAWQISSGVTGIRALELSRVRTTVKVTDTPKPPPPSKRGRPDVPDDFDLLWQRAPEADERGLAWVHAYDLNAMYLAAAGRVRLGLGEAQHRDDPEFDRNLPGYWRIDPGTWAHARLPNPFDPTGRGRPGPVWVTTPRLQAVSELGWWDGQVLEAYVWPTVAPGNRQPGSRYLEHWADRLRNVRAALAPADPDAPEDPVLRAVKWTYAHGIGRLNADAAEGHPLYRPHWRHHIIGTATGNLLRKLDKCAQLGRWPLAIATDCVLYASDDPNPETACPEGLPFDSGGRQLGHAKPAGTAPMADVLPLLAAGNRPDKSALLSLFAVEE